MDLSNYELIFRKMIKPEDLNPANRLLGGKLLAWADEAVALYTMSQMQTKSVATKKISEVIFNNPSFQGDILECYVKNAKVGTTSLTISCRVLTEPIDEKEEKKEILNCEFVFVAIDDNGRPTPHHMAKI